MPTVFLASLLQAVHALVLLAPPSTSVPARPDASVPARPNIVHIVADDLGWKDVGFNGCADIKTPNIDALAAGGAVLAEFYV